MRIPKKMIRLGVAFIVIISLSTQAADITSKENRFKTETDTQLSDAIVVIAKADSDIDSISARDVRKLYLGKTRKLSRGGLVNLAILDPLNARFNSLALRKTTAQVDSIWSRLRFSGRTKPPVVFDNHEDVIEFVNNTDNAIGFVLGSSLDSSVKTVFVVK